MKKLTRFLPFGILISLFLPCLMTALKIENDGGMPIFIIGLFACIILSVLYFVNFIRNLILVKKGILEPQTEIPFLKIKKAILLCTALCFHISAFIFNALNSGYKRYYFMDNMLVVYFMLAFLITALDLILCNFKTALKLRALIISFISIAVVVIMSDLSVLISIPVAALVCILALIATYIIGKKSPARLFGEISIKAVSLLCVGAVAMSGCCIALLLVGKSVSATREKEIIEALKGKKFARTASDHLLRGYDFNEEGKVAEVGNYENYSYTYEDTEITFNLFGFGVPLYDGYEEIEFDKKENPTAIISAGGDRYELSDTIPEYKEYTPSSSGSSTTVYGLPTIDEYIAKLKTTYPNAAITELKRTGNNFSFRLSGMLVSGALDNSGKIKSVVATISDASAKTADGAATSLGVTLAPATALMQLCGNYYTASAVADKLLSNAEYSSTGIDNTITIGKFEIQYSYMQFVGTTMIICSYEG